MTDDDDMQEVVAEFLIESHENLDELDRSLLELEQDPTNRNILGSIFRTVHTIKGTSGFLGFDNLQGLTHVAESLLSGLRDATLRLTPDATTALFATVDAVRAMLATVEADGTDGTDDYAALIADLGRLQDPSLHPATDQAPADQPVADQPLADQPLADKPLADKPLIAPVALPLAAVAPPEAGVAQGDPILAQAAPAERAVPVPAQAAEAEPRPAATVATELDRPAVEVVAPRPVEPAVAADPLGRERWDDAATDPSASSSTSTIRVDVGQLDKLMNLVGELVLARNQILQSSAGVGDPSFVATAQRLNLITSELQEGVMKTRMQPIGTVWSKFPRIVRDLAVSCGKQIRLEMEGRETELDKTLIEAIKDPLTHLVRNAVDHGIETAERRALVGKPAEGRLYLRAYHESGHVTIEIADDGAGINTERVRAKALANGLVRPEVADRMSERELTSLIFLPGFSTADTITNVSGRGVGMDVVKTNIERIGGSVDVSSDPGSGTIFRITIPLTLAIIPALIVTAEGDRYAIPQVNLVELVRLKAGGGASGIELVHGVPVHRLRGRLLPLVNLSYELGVSQHALPSDPDMAVSIVVLQAADQQFGLIVDEISDTEEIVVKPLSQQLKAVGAFAGATIMGDGRVALILDVVGVAQRAAVLSELRERMKDDPLDAAGELEDGVTEALLIVGVGATHRMAINLTAVNRLEEFDPSSVETAGDLEVVQYRDSLLPLINVAATFGIVGQPSEQLQVVVHNDGRRTVGLVVDKILDIVEERVVVHTEGMTRGVIGSAIIQGHVTDIVDLPGLTSTLRFPSEALREVA